MNTVLQIELSPDERDVLLQGLRFVRSSLMLETRDPNEQDEKRRGEMLDEIQMLSQRLEATDPVKSAQV